VSGIGLGSIRRDAHALRRTRHSIVDEDVLRAILVARQVLLAPLVNASACSARAPERWRRAGPIDSETGCSRATARR